MELPSLGVCQQGASLRRALAHHELGEDRVDAAHVAVLLQAHHVAGAELAVLVEVAVLHEMADGLHAVLAGTTWRCRHTWCGPRPRRSASRYW